MGNGRGNEEKRLRILDAAVVEIAQHGYFQTTIAMIACRAGVADGTIYLYFKNKQELLYSVFERAMSVFISEGRAQLTRRQGAEARLRRLMELHLESVGRDRDLAVIFQVELRHSLHFMEHFSRNSIRECLGIIAAVVEEGQTEGVFRPELDPLLTAKAIFGVLDEMATDWVLSRRNVRLSACATEISDILLRGILADA